MVITQFVPQKKQKTKLVTYVESTHMTDFLNVTLRNSVLSRNVTYIIEVRVNFQASNRPVWHCQEDAGNHRRLIFYADSLCRQNAQFL